MTDIQKDLLPCPFCGGRADWQDASGATGTQYYCLCVEEGVLHGCCRQDATYARKTDAIKAWNSRAPAARLETDPMVEEFQEGDKFFKAGYALGKKDAHLESGGAKPCGVPMRNEKEIVDGIAEAIAGVRWDKYERPAGNTQCRTEYAFYLKGAWLDEAKAAYESIRVDALNSVGQQDGWRDIESAPKDGTRIIVMYDDCPTLPAHVELGKYREGYCCNTYGHRFSGEPTHWMPLPAAPLGRKDEK